MNCCIKCYGFSDFARKQVIDGYNRRERKVNILEIKNARGGKLSKVKVENNRHPGCPASFVVPKILTQSFSDIFQLWLPFMDDVFSSPTDGRETGLIVSSVINY